MEANNANLADLIRQSNVLLGVLARAELRGVMKTELVDPKKKKLYELTDGSQTSRALSGKVGMSIAAISRTWQHWENCGMVVKDRRSYVRTLG